MIESKVRMREFKHFNENVGVDGIHFVGLPGSGKTSFAQLIAKDLMKELNENILLSGDRFCEWKHFLRYPRIVKKIILFLPDNHDLFYYLIPFDKENNKLDDKVISEKYNVDFESIKVNLDKFDIKDYLTNKTEKTVFAIYDNHYKGPLLWKRAELWKRITNQLLDRTVLLDTAITTLYNEGGILWQEGASDKHWKEINEYAEISVENRKGFVRVMMLSQLETEVYHPIRRKMLWKCFRLGLVSRLAPRPVRKAAPFQSRSAYILTYGGLYSIGNQTPKLSELKLKWKIIPQGKLQVDESEQETENNGKEQAKRDYIIYHKYRIEKVRRNDLAQQYSLHPTRISQIAKEIELSLMSE